MTYTINDIKVLEEDTTEDDPNMLTPKVELPGELWNQSYPKRIRHSFPNQEKWMKKVDVNGGQVPRWKKYILENYLKQ